MRILRSLGFYLLGIIGIVCISVFPKFFSQGTLNPIYYFKELYVFIIEFVNPESWVYFLPITNEKVPIFEVLWDPFIYSMQILVSALLIGFLSALILALSANFLPKTVLYPIKRSLDFLEAVPDVIIVILLQLFSVYIYVTFAVDLYRVANYMDRQSYFGPIFALSIIPMISMFKVLLLMIEEELMKDYVSFLKSKGIKKYGILVKHVLKNIMPNTFSHMKIIIWATLSSQFVIEYMFNIDGLTYFLVYSLTPTAIAISLILVFTPFFFFFQVIDHWLSRDELHMHQLKKENWWDRKATLSFKESINLLYSNFLFRIKHISVSKLNPLNPIVYLFSLFWTHMKNWKFALGSLFFILTISFSVIFSIVTDNQVDQIWMVYEEDGVTIKSAPPHAPTEPFILGSNKYGYSLYDRIAMGAKFTLIFGLLIAFLRVFGGLLFGLIYAFKLKPVYQQWLSKLVDSIYFLPLSAIAYVLLRPILFETRDGFAYSFTERIVLEVVILTVLVVPLTTVLLGKDMKNVLQNEFVMSAKVLGGSKLYIFRKHVLPHIGPRMTILFSQQFIQVLLIFIHLGIFGFNLGGSQLDSNGSVTYEWSGLLSSSLHALKTGKYWLIAWVLIAFMLSIFAMQLILQGVKEVQQVKVGVIYKLSNRRKIKQKRNYKSYTVSSDSFEVVEYKENYRN